MRNELLHSCRAPGTTGFKHLDGLSEAIGEVLQRTARHAEGKRVRKHQTFALAQPLDMAAGALRLRRENERRELKSQNKRLEGVFASN